MGVAASFTEGLLLCRLRPFAMAICLWFGLLKGLFNTSQVMDKIDWPKNELS